MARKILFPIKMHSSKHHYTQNEFKKQFILHKHAISKSINSLLVRPIVHQIKQDCKICDIHHNTNSEFYNKTTFSKPIVRDEKSYADYRFLKLHQSRYINNIQNPNCINIFLSSGSGSGSNLSSNSNFYLDADSIICGYGLDLI